MKKIQAEARIGEHNVILETGVMAKQANGSCLLRCGNCVILATVTMSKKPKEGVDFFPLTVEFQEKMYSAGKIPGGFFKRETRPSTLATLIARLIDRSIRPCFPDHFYHEVQVVVTVLSHDDSIYADSLYITAASAALIVSDIPFNGPIAAANVLDTTSSLQVNPKGILEEPVLDMVVAGTKDAVLMIESQAKEISEERIIEAIQEGHKTIKQYVSLQEDLVNQLDITKLEVKAVQYDQVLYQKIESFLGEKIKENLRSGDKKETEAFLDQLKENCLKEVESDDDVYNQQAAQIFAKLKKEQIRKTVIEDKIRPDGRALDEIRSISGETALLPSVHGSALFTRGETQSLGVVTLGTNQDEQIEDGLSESKRHPYFFHYNFPPFSVGETGMIRTGRRELGHGALAQRALEAVLPKYTNFPYTIRIVSEILESNGSSSMASVCSGSLSMMDCGVPIKAPVSGIAMGLLLDEQGNYVVLSDIQGLEDHYGDMDFKVAGTREGITALQLDIKVAGLTQEILKHALEQAKGGRFHILDEMNTILEAPRSEVASNAPKIEFIKIDPEKVGLLIGPGGKNIKKIEEDTGATVFVVDGSTGEVSLSGPSSDSVNAARQIVERSLKSLEVGDVLSSKVVKIVPFGAFVELETGKEALLHISKIAKERIEKVEDYISLGDTFDVKVSEIDARGGKIAVSKIFDV